MAKPDTLDLYTARIGSYRGQDAYDITVKSGDKAFAPTWELVTAWKQGGIDWDTYRQQYRQLMLKSYNENKNAWTKLVGKSTVTLTCYCSDSEGKHCHRYLLAEFLKSLGEKIGIHVTYHGERETKPKQRGLFE